MTFSVWAGVRVTTRRGVQRRPATLRDVLANAEILSDEKGATTAG